MGTVTTFVSQWVETVWKTFALDYCGPTAGLYLFNRTFDLSVCLVDSTIQNRNFNWRFIFPEVANLFEDRTETNVREPSI